MGMSEHDDKEKCEREVRLWLRIRGRGISYERYLKLQTHLKSVLHNLICIPTRPTTYTQREELYRKLCLESTAGIKSPYPDDFVTDEELRKVFSPLTPSERLHDLEKY